MPLDVALDVLLKVTLLFLAGWMVTTVMWRASAASRHAVWAAVCVAALALPVAQLALPTVSTAWWPSWPQTVTVSRATPAMPSSSGVIETAGSVVTGDSGVPAPAPAPWWPLAVAGVWVLGAGVGCVRLAVGRRAAQALIAASIPETDARVLTCADRAAGWLGVPAVTIRRGGADWMPATWGVRCPVVVLPSTVVEWSETRLEPVLLHELAHVQRRDAVWHQLAQLMVAVWWMHPLAWVAARQLRVERERACDDLVLAYGARASDYASELVSLVGVCGTDMTLAMARRSQLEGRVMAILNPRLNRNGRTGVATLVAAALVLAMAPLAAMRSATTIPDAPVAGQTAQHAQEVVRVGSQIAPPMKIKDVRPVYPPIALSARVEGVVIVEVDIDTEGAVSAARVLRPVALLDEAALEAVRQWRFTPTVLNGQPVPVVMTVSVAFRLGPDGQPAPPPPPPSPAPPAVVAPAALPQPAAVSWNPGDPPLRIGGQIKEPKKLKDVRPVYPEIALHARVQGVVILEVQIDQDGRVSNARVLRPVALLDDAAIDAVLQWEFMPTLVNGQPVPVIMTVTVNFTLQ